MSDYALYRLPEMTKYHLVEGNTIELGKIGELADHKGFVLAPFNIGGDNPLLMIESEDTQLMDFPEGSGESHNAVVSFEDSHRECYKKDFKAFHDSLDNGSVDKIVLSRRLDLTMDSDINVKEVFYAACRMYPHQMIALVSTELGGKWLMATPEVLLENDGNSVNASSWKTMALAGTMTTPGPWSDKNLKEQYYVAEYIFNCLSRHSFLVKYSSPHTVSAAKLYHIRTDFAFNVNTADDALKVLDDLHPTPAVCGIPKAKAFDFILNNESINRKYYSGFSGPLCLDGETHLFVSLRCMEIEGRKCHLYAGGGLLKESEEGTEWNETEVKLKTMKDVLG